MAVKIYLAAPWVAKAEAKLIAQQFRDAGFDLTSRWHDKHIEGQDVDKSHDVLQNEASEDLQDILQSDGMVVLQTKKSEGKAFEQGFAIAASQYTGMRNKIVIISADGSRGNVFQYLDLIYTLVPTVEAAIEECKTWPEYVQLADLVKMEAESGVN